MSIALPSLMMSGKPLSFPRQTHARSWASSPCTLPSLGALPLLRPPHQVCLTLPQSLVSSVLAIGGDGKTEALSVPIAVLTLDGVSTIQTTVPTTATNSQESSASGSSAPVTAAAGTFVVSGAGNGHNVGLSQWGAYAMAKRGYTYDQILNFYYTGIDLH